MFKNEPLTDFTLPAARRSYEEALERLNNKIKSGGLRAAPIVDGEELSTQYSIVRNDPSNPTITIGTISLASEMDVDRALASLKYGRSAWAKTKFEERSRIIRTAGEAMRQKKSDLAALIIREAGKPWREADADVAEAIDFCLYYADEMLRLGAPVKTMEVPGEDNFYFYQPRGIAAVISPWNFPLAIACGMVVAALVTGNVVVLKPAEQTSLIGYELAKILYAAGVPKNAFAFLPGVGETVGRKLVKSPDINIIAFTGSKNVGLEIVKSAGESAKSQSHITRVIAELGGKNAIIVDEDADLDEAVKGVLNSAFGFAGQKCSACSRVVVVGSAYEPFIKRFCEAASDIIAGLPSDSATLLPPVIDDEAQTRILRTITEAEKSCKVAFKGKVPTVGYFVPPTIFRDVQPTASIWREEIFGPVVAIRKVDSFEEAISAANDSQYALTGGLFSRTPSHIETARREFSVGNLYINRGCTGALVCRQPFGGFKMSGIGSKAGGPDYLIQFMEPRCVTENTMRRGFTPETR